MIFTEKKVSLIVYGFFMRIIFFIIIYFVLIFNAHAKDSLSDYYSAYIFVKNCNELDQFFYVDNENMEIARKSIKNIEKEYKNTNNNIDVDAEWSKAVTKWKEDFESMFAMFKSLDTYSEDLAGMCKLYLLMLNALGSSYENESIEKDF